MRLKQTVAVVAMAAICTIDGAQMYPNKDIIDNAINSDDLSNLVAVVKVAGLVDTLKGPGPFTVFAPNNEAFDKLPAGTVDKLLRPENKDELVKVLTYHVVPGQVTSKQLISMIKNGNGKAALKTVQGGALTAMMNGNDLVLKDAKGDTAKVMIADVYQKNGIIHVVDNVLLPN